MSSIISGVSRAQGRHFIHVSAAETARKPTGPGDSFAAATHSIP